VEDGAEDVVVEGSYHSKLTFIWTITCILLGIATAQ
jgi:hypothetical protein